MNTRGNNAYKIDEVNSQPYYIPENKIEEKKIILKEIKLKQQDTKVKKRIVACIALIITLGVTVAIRYASATQINYENQKLEQQYNELMAITENLEVEIESSMSIVEIAEIAETKLDMHKPLEYQIEHIDVDSIDQTEYKDTSIKGVEESKTFVERLKNKVKLFLGLI